MDFDETSISKTQDHPVVERIFQLSFQRILPIFENKDIHAWKLWIIFLQKKKKTSSKETKSVLWK